MPVTSKLIWPILALAVFAALWLAIFFDRFQSPPGPTPLRLVTQLHDGNRDIGLTTEGRLYGFPPLSPEDTDLLVQVLTEHELPMGLPRSNSRPDRATAERIARAHDGSHLLLAALYARSGMTSRARAEVDILGQQNPDITLVHELKSSLR